MRLVLIYIYVCIVIIIFSFSCYYIESGREGGGVVDSYICVMFCVYSLYRRKDDIFRVYLNFVLIR